MPRTLPAAASPLLLLALSLGACRSSEDAGAVPAPFQPVSDEAALDPVDWDVDGAEIVGQHWGRDLLADPEIWARVQTARALEERVVVFLAGIANDTGRELDTTTALTAVGRSMLGGGGVRLVPNHEAEDEVRARVLHERRRGRKLEEVGRQLAGELGAELVVHGRITKSRAGSSGVREESWRVRLACADVETGEELWSAERELERDQAVRVFAP